MGATPQPADKYTWIFRAILTALISFVLSTTLKSYNSLLTMTEQVKGHEQRISRIENYTFLKQGDILSNTTTAKN